MKITKVMSLFFILILILPSISSIVSSQEPEEEDSFIDKIIYRLLRRRFFIGFNEQLYMGRYFTLQLKPPVPIQAFPESVNIDYLNETTFIIGARNEEDTDWELIIKQAGTWNWAWMNKQIIFTFEFIPPEGLPEDMWIVDFDPKQISIIPNRENLDWPGALTPLRTNVTITLKPNIDPSIVTGDVILKFNIVREETLDKLGIWKGSPEFMRTYKEEYIQACEDLGVNAYFYKAGPLFIFYYNLPIIGTKNSMFLRNRVLPFYDKWIDSTVEVLIKVNKFHLAEIEPILPQKIEPYQIKSIPLNIRNIGSHIDTFNFRVRSNDKNMVVTPPPVLTLKPGEEAQALVGVAAPRRFYSIGSTTSIFVEAYSIDDPDKVFPQTIILSTSGIHTTGAPTYSFVLLIITLLILMMILLYFLRRRREKISKKPDKPWDIPEEKEHLEKLREKDKNEYKATLSMMEEEYESALLWYKYYTDATIKKKGRLRKQEETKRREERIKMKEKIREDKKEKKAKEEELKKEAKQKRKEEKLKEEVKPEVKEKEPILPKKKEKKPVVIIDKQAELEKQRKEKALLRIKREQEKQKRKLQV